MEKPSLKERFLYWFDSRMSKGSLGLIRFLVLFSVLFVFLLCGILIAFGFQEDQSITGVLWDGFSTIINAWMPSAEDGTIGYLIIMALIALMGLLVTSVLIGIVTSAMEEKIMQLRRGNSAVLEKNHKIILGFFPGEYTLLQQLILAAGNNPAVIVIGSGLERDEIEQLIKDNVDVPKNVKIICRTIDIFDPASIEKLSVHTCRNILISPMDDQNTIKVLLAVSALISQTGSRTVRVSAITAKRENRFPPTIAKKHNVTTLQTNDTLAKIIAHSCTQTGLSQVFQEVFNFEGSELYNISMPETAGLTFEDLIFRMDHAVPVGIYRNHTVMMNPDRAELIRDTDKIMVFAEEKHSAKLSDTYEKADLEDRILPVRPERNTKVLVFGYNETLATVLRELPENVQKVTIVNYSGPYRSGIEKICAERGMEPEFTEGHLRLESSLLEITRNAEHIIILTNHDDHADAADMDTIFLILNLRDIRSKYHLRYNITAEMRSEMNQHLIVSDDHTDYIVASNMSSLFLAQLSESPELITAFRELLSNDGNELYMKKAVHLNCIGEMTVAEIRQIVSAQGYIFLGYMNSDSRPVFNPGLHETIEIRRSDSFIVLGRN